MDDVLSHSPRVSREALHDLMARRDGPGLAHLLVSIALLVTAGTAACILAARGDPWWPAASLVCGAALVSFFPALHESGHGTAFRSPWLNRATAWLGAVLMLQAPSFFREFHFEHHRQTHDPARDPEVALAPGLLASWPKNLFFWLALASGQGLMFGKLMFTIACALLPYSVWRRVFPWVRAAQAGVVARDSRISLAVLTLAVVAGLTYVPGFTALLLAWPIAHVLLGLYLMPEHTGLPHTGDQLHRTRTITSNAAVRWWMWNMPYHGEHHAYPAVPFHALPRLHDLLAPELEHTSRGYLAFHAEALLRTLVRHT